MELKKNPSKDLEKNKGVFLALGLCICLLVIWFSFKSTQQIKAAEDLGDTQAEKVEMELAPVTREEKIATPPPPPPPPQVSTEIEIVDNDVNVETDFELFDDDVNKDFEIQQVVKQAPVEVVQKEEEIVLIAEEMPEFPGGYPALQKWIGGELDYPVVAQENGVQGRVIVQFVVWKDGTVKDGVVLRPVNPALDKEALRVVAKMPNWKPGKQGGRAVNCRFQIPITFKLQN
ncbi:MAG: energy transducer TonB [Bacteroidales bacterium]